MHGLDLSRTSGNARETMTDIEYSRNERSISRLISLARRRQGLRPLPESLTRIRSFLCHDSFFLDVKESNVFRIGLDEMTTLRYVVAHQD